MKSIKVGDTVDISDGSWGLKVTQNNNTSDWERRYTLGRTNGVYLKSRNPFQVVATNCGPLPTDKRGVMSSVRDNDTILRTVVLGEIIVVFTHSSLCEKIEVCPTCGHSK